MTSRSPIASPSRVVRAAATAGVVASFAFMSACADPPMASANAAGRPASAAATLAPTQGSATSGSIMFAQQGDRVVVKASVKGLTAGQEHGFHVHEKGDCSSPDAESAGGHFNPTATPHGPQGGPHHGGDLPSLKADAAGNAEASFTVAGHAGASSVDALIGRAVVVHANPDDYATQPSGNSGKRIACGVIAAMR